MNKLCCMVNPTLMCDKCNWPICNECADQAITLTQMHEGDHPKCDGSLISVGRRFKTIQTKPLRIKPNACK